MLYYGIDLPEPKCIQIQFLRLRAFYSASDLLYFYSCHNDEN